MSKSKKSNFIGNALEFKNFDKHQKPPMQKLYMGWRMKLREVKNIPNLRTLHTSQPKVE